MVELLHVEVSLGFLKPKLPSRHPSLGSFKVRRINLSIILCDCVNFNYIVMCWICNAKYILQKHFIHSSLT